jgi:predicted nucleic-acid-binding protein
MRAVDTNLIVRIIARDDPKQVALAEEFIRPGAWVSQLALAEAAWVLESVYQRKAAEIMTAIEMLLSHENLTIEDSEVVSLALEKFRGKPTVGFSDCLLLEIARKAGHLPLGTFDRDLGKLEGAQKL